MTRRTTSRLTAALLVALAAPAFAIDEADLARRQTDQRQARAMARELVSTVLDLQLRQLEENGLTDLPLYRDIQTMRGNLARLVEAEMAEVVERLVEAQHATGAEREAKFVEARRATRAVVVRLSVERQALLRRLKAAEIVEQATRLVELQTAARESAAGLPGLPEDRRPDAALRALEDQRDVRELFVRLVETLGDVKTWDGPIATAASDGLRLLKDADAGRHLDDAEKTLASASFGETARHQDAVLDALRKLLSLIEKAQGQLDSQGAGLAETVRRLRGRQQALRDQVQKEGLSEPKPESVEAQQKIATALAELARDVANNPTAEPLRKQAESAAKSAAEALFAADEDRTLAEQQRAIDRLTALEAALATGTEDNHDRSAAELAKIVRDLEAAKRELQQAADKHAEAAKQSAANPQAAGEAERSAAEQATKIDDGKELPAAVAARIEDAADAARSAAEALAAAAGNDAAKSKAREDVADAGDAFQRAQAAVEEALADAKRSEAAVRVGELARAAEALERAAAAERQLAGDATAASKSAGLTPEQAGEMKHVQTDVIGVAAKTAEGVKAAAPQAAEALGRALDAAKQADSALAQAAATPGEPSKPAASKAGEQAGQAAQAITQAAAALRAEIGKAASELAGLAGEQLKPVAAAEQAVAQATEAVSGDPKAAAQAAERAADTSAAAEEAATAAAQAARAALTGQGTAEDAADALDRAAIGLAAREQQLVQDRQLAERLGQLAGYQQSAVERIDQARQQLIGAPSDPAAMSPPQKQAAQALHAATRQFAAAQRATGQGAARISGQEQVANVPIREALETAERLPLPQLPTAPIPGPEGEQVAQGDRGEKVEGAQQPAANSGAENQNQAGAAQNSSKSGTPSDTGSAQPGGTEATGLGTGLVPAAPQETARMMAGADAQAALAAMEALQASESMEDVAASDTDFALNDATPPGQNADDAQQSAQKGAPTRNGPPADSDSQSADASGRDSDAGPNAGRDAAWFAKLPPELRAAIRGSANQPAPKGYEGKLRRYFESVDK